MLTAAYFLIVGGQMAYWFLFRDATERVSNETWEACLYPGKEQDSAEHYV